MKIVRENFLLETEKLEECFGRELNYHCHV